MNPSEAHIVVHQDPTTQQLFPLAEGVITIGRESHNDVVLIDPEASRKHAQISFQAGRYVVEDLGSTNGTFVNGRQIQTATTLNNGDIIEVGEMARILYQGPGTDLGETVLRAPSSSKDATIAMSDDMATFSEPIPDIADADLTMQEPEPQFEPATVMPVEAAPEGVPGSEPAQDGRFSRRYLATCGCLIVLVAMLCAATIFLLDALTPNTLYCGPAEGLFEFLGFIMDCG